MKRKQLKEIQLKTIKELKELIKKAREELVKSKTDLSSGKLKNIHQVKQQRRNLARLKTILKEKEMKEPKTEKLTGKAK